MTLRPSLGIGPMFPKTSRDVDEPPFSVGLGDIANISGQAHFVQFVFGSLHVCDVAVCVR